MTFARALRAILRQDPDVVMIGEIRDLETAQIAVQASLTGHLVLATLHTNDAPGRRHAPDRHGHRALPARLHAERRARPAPGAQALRRSARRPTEDERRAHLQAVGCAACNFSGYKGRTGIYELLTVDDDLRRLVHDTAAERELREHAVAHGMMRLREDGMRWVREGVDVARRGVARHAQR